MPLFQLSRGTSRQDPNKETVAKKKKEVSQKVIDRNDLNENDMIESPSKTMISPVKSSLKHSKENLKITNRRSVHKRDVEM